MRLFKIKKILKEIKCINMSKLKFQRIGLTPDIFLIHSAYKKITEKHLQSPKEKQNF